MSNDLSIICLVVDHTCKPLGTSFSVPVARTDQVEQLEKKVREKRHYLLSQWDAADLLVWKLHEALAIDDHFTLVEEVQALQLNRETRNDMAIVLHPTRKISGAFNEELAEERVHVLIQLPELQAPAKSSLTPSSSAELEKSKGGSLFPVLPPSRLHTFWMASWGNLDLVQQRSYKGNTHGIIDFPLKYQTVNLATSSRPDSLEPVMTGILILDEYLEAARVAISYSMQPRFTEDRTGDTSMDIDTASAEFENPFDKLIPEQVRSKVLVARGPPGSGKTVWLQFLLALRLQARLPTLFQYSPHYGYLFDESGVFSYSTTKELPSEIRARVPGSTWILVDSNDDLRTVPSYLRAMGLFLIQSASPRPERTEWTMKADQTASPIYYWMKEWSLQELLIGAELQTLRPSSEDLVKFYQKFGPSARLAYTHARNTNPLEEGLKYKVSILSLDKLDSILRDVVVASLSHEISHLLFLLSPDDQDRSKFKVSIPSRFIFNLVQERVQQEGNRQVAKLFQLFLRHPYTMSSAGYILDGRIHDLLKKGRRWPVSRMEWKPRPGSKYWHLQMSNKFSQLYIGFAKWAAIIDPPSMYGTFADLPDHLYHPCAAIQLKTGYYWPASRSRATFDSFIFDEGTQTAFALQATVSKEHSFQPKGFDNLVALGAKKVIFIAISPLKELEIPVPRPWKDTHPQVEFYHLYLDDLSDFTTGSSATTSSWNPISGLLKLALEYINL